MSPFWIQALWAAGGFLACRLLTSSYGGKCIVCFGKSGSATGFGASDDTGWPDPNGLPEGLTPARVALHARLMDECHDPRKLQKAAQLFGAEGLTECAQALLRKAAMIHQQMHGARELVERFRAGDQHAIAMIDAIGQAARAGQKRAAVSRFLIIDYTMKHPANGRGAPAA